MMRRYAWYKLYNLAKTYNKNLTGSDVQTLAGNVLLSALAIPPFGAADMARSEAAAEQEKERSMRMANLLGFSVVRTHTVHRGSAHCLATGDIDDIRPQCHTWPGVVEVEEIGMRARLLLVGQVPLCEIVAQAAHRGLRNHLFSG